MYPQTRLEFNRISKFISKKSIRERVTTVVHCLSRNIALLKHQRNKSIFYESVAIKDFETYPSFSCLI